LDRVGEVDLRGVDAGVVHSPPQQVSGWPDERLAAPVLDVTGLFAHHHHPGVGTAPAEYGLSGMLIEPAAPAPGGRLAEPVEIGTGRDELPRATRGFGHRPFLPHSLSGLSRGLSGLSRWPVGPRLPPRRRAPVRPAGRCPRRADAGQRAPAASAWGSRWFGRGQVAITSAAVMRTRFLATNSPSMVSMRGLPSRKIAAGSITTVRKVPARWATI